MALFGNYNILSSKLLAHTNRADHIDNEAAFVVDNEQACVVSQLKTTRHATVQSPTTMNATCVADIVSLPRVA